MSNDDDNEEGLTPAANPDEVNADSGLGEADKPSGGGGGGDDDGTTFSVELTNHVVPVIDGSKRNPTPSAATDSNCAGASEASPSRRTTAVRRISAPLLPMPVFTSITTSACSDPSPQLQNRRGSGGGPGLLATADEPYVFSRTQLSGKTTAIHPVERDLRTAVGNVVSSTATGARRRLSDPVCGRSWYSNRANWSAAVMPSSTSSLRDTLTSAFAGGNFDAGSRRGCCQSSSGATATPPPSPTSTTAPDGSISGSVFADHARPQRRHSLALGQLSSSSQLNAIDEEGATSCAGGERVATTSLQ